MARHPADLVSLTFGLFFAAIGLTMLFGGTIDALSWEWVAPAAAIALGALLIVGARPGRTAVDEQ